MSVESSDTLGRTLERLSAGLAAEEAAHYDLLDTTVRKLDQRDVALASGTVAPDFRLPSETGLSLSLAELLQNGPTLIVFARGPWCPFCLAELAAFREFSPQFHAAGLGIVAITPTVSGGAKTLRDELDLPFPVLCDVGSGVTLSFGCLFALPEPAYQWLNDDQFSLAELFGDEGRFMLLPTCFGIDRDRTILTVAGETDMRRFPAIEEILGSFQAALAERQTN
ncbi:MAG: peroxiredoxin-like family protein [Pseudomonadota bacterium]